MLHLKHIANKLTDKQSTIKLKVFFSLLFILFLCFSSTVKGVMAADPNFINQVRVEYLDFEQKTTKEFNQYLDNTTKNYKQYYNRQNEILDLFVIQTEADSKRLEQLLNADLEQLEKQYGNNKSYSSKLRDYSSKINLNRLNSSMNQYATSMNPHRLNSLMNRFSNAVNENRLNSSMYEYSSAINEHRLNSPMYSYSGEINENRLNSSMYDLSKASNEHSLNSIMYRYSKDQITQEEASNEWAQFKKSEIGDLQANINRFKTNLNQIEKKSRSDIYKQKCATIHGILEQRAKSLQTVSTTRAAYFGKGIDFPNLVPSIGEINVLLDGKWLCFEQPPMMKGGSTIVPLRVIFEELGASVNWNSKTQSVTAKKGSTTIVLTINKKVATINGKSISLQSPPELINGHTMVPVRFVSEALGANVKWDGGSKTVFITTK
ncbi:copper amine oxidase N-terminal domain-containing protein [Bacillus sp. CGMCC 1.16607]|uniref:copper amine oxidase N-terminal domain-containing protein n=1 Tax=Bacillus sp. CGMCC 1.16607 TaxID=3351842 RepID=UPI0036384964